MNYMRAVIFVAAWAFASITFAVDRNFDIPLASLETWAQSIIVEMPTGTILGNSGVHKVNSDCEMHFGAAVEGYKGDPPGWVLEPMNLCVENYFGKQRRSDSDWIAFAKSIIKKKVVAHGVPRIWPEHLIGGKPPSNPNHAMELHPLTRLVVGQKSYDFAKFIYAPGGFEGGLSRATALKLIDDLDVSVTTNGETVEIEFDAGRIGNFTTLDIRIDKQAISAASGGHRLQAFVYADKGKLVPVTVITVAGSEIDSQVAALSGQKSRYFRLPALVLFSLDPVALLAAAKGNSGQKTPVKSPIQLIIYGKEED